MILMFRSIFDSACVSVILKRPFVFRLTLRPRGLSASQEVVTHSMIGVTRICYIAFYSIGFRNESYVD